MSNVTEQLRNDAEYYKGVGKNYLSNSDISALLGNPKEYGVEREDNKSFAEGRLFHQLLIEPDKAIDAHIVDASTRNTKIYKDYCDANGLDFCLLQHEVDRVKSLTQVMKSNIYFYDEIYKDGNLYEEPAIGEIKGMMWKGKADIITDEVIIDLKTTSDIKKFKWSAKAYNYDSQAYIYQKLSKDFYTIKNTDKSHVYPTSFNIFASPATIHSVRASLIGGFFVKYNIHKRQNSD